MVRLARVLPHQHRHADRAHRPPRAHERPAGLRARADLRGRRARPPAGAGARDRRARQPQRAAGGARHPPRHPQGPRPAAARGRDPGRGVPRAGRPHRRRQGGPAAFVEKRAAEVAGADDGDFETIRYETSPDHVATITLDRPEVLNAFDRQMCEEIARRLAAGQGRPRRSTPWCCGPRATGRSAPGSTPRSPTASPTTSGTTRTPASCSARSGRRCGSRWCARCRASAPPAPSTSSTRPTSSSARTDATFFDSHVTYGMVSALEPVGLMRTDRPRRDAAHGAVGQRRAGRPPRRRCASAW